MGVLGNCLNKKIEKDLSSLYHCASTELKVTKSTKFDKMARLRKEINFL